MSQNLADLNLTDADLIALNGALATIRTTLGDRAVSLTPDQRRSLVKMGDGSRTFCEQAVDALLSNANSLPPDFDLPALIQDMEDYEKLAACITTYEQQGEALDDTLKALASDVMTNAIIGVSFLKALNKLNPALDGLLRGLREVRRRRAAPPAVPPTPPTP